MTSHRHRLAGHLAGTLLLLAASAHARPSPRPAARLPVRPESIATQVRRAHPELRSHKRLEDFHASPYHPTQIVERIHALESDAAWDELCAELARLPDEELELFEDELRKPEHARRMRCAPALLARLDAYWKGAERRLSEAHPAAPAIPQLASVPIKVDLTKGEAFTDGNLSQGEIAITFDDGPHVTRTPRVLQILKAAGVKATFFAIGRNAAAHPDVARQVLAAGHPVGSHTFSHVNVPRVG
jgi:hypothetical protein